MAHGSSTGDDRLPITLENYRFESERLNSFVGWPLCDPVKPKQLARAGYVYTGEGALVQCPECGVKYHWHPMVNARERHNPDCSFSSKRSSNANDCDGQFPVRYYLTDQSFVVSSPVSNPNSQEVVLPSLPLIQASDTPHRRPIQASVTPEALPIQATEPVPIEATSESDVDCSPFIRPSSGSQQTAFSLELRRDHTKQTSRPCADMTCLPGAVVSKCNISYDPVAPAAGVSAIPSACALKGEYPPYLPIAPTTLQYHYSCSSGQSVASGPATVALYNNTYLSLKLDGSGRGSFVLSEMVHSNSSVAERMDITSDQHYNDYYLCRICWEVFINTILLPCRHVAMCRRCAVREQLDNGTCPFCRQCIDNVETAILM